MNKNRKYIPFNFISISLMVTAFAVAVGLLYDYFFDLNDDVLMKDILAGVFTGTPEGHNIQMLYPISFAISLFYKVVRSLDWYGIYLLLCQYVSITVLLYFLATRVAPVILPISKEEKKQSEIKTLMVAAAGLLVLSGLMLGHIVILQYTFTVALLCSMAAALSAMGRDSLAVLVIMISFCTRSEMTLLMLPFVLLVIFYRYMEKRGEEGSFKKHLIFVLVIAGGLLISELLHLAGYSSKGWKEFNSFFDSRTQIYDFYQIPGYEEHKEFYDSIGLAKTEYDLLVNYNFGIDDEIDAELMKKISDYAGEVRNEEGLASRLRTVLPEYFYRLRAVSFPKSYEYPMTDAPFNIIALLLYLLVLFACVSKDREKIPVKNRILGAVWKTGILFAGRSLLWMYILVRGRDPIRITHSLYLLEIVVLLILFAFITGDFSEAEGTGEKYSKSAYRIMWAICGLVLFAGIIYIPSQAAVTQKECLGRKEYNRAYEELEKYFRENEDNFYFIDVYSSVAYDDSGYTYSQKLFENVDNSAANWTLMGGWASKSPAERDKLLKFSLGDNMKEALLLDNTYVVATCYTDMSWLFDYYEEKGIETEISADCDIAETFTIYKVTME